MVEKKEEIGVKGGRIFWGFQFDETIREYAEEACARPLQDADGE